MKESEVRLASPCGMDFRTMTPVEGGRLCEECQIVVRDLSSMTEAEARALLAETGQARLCVRYLYDDAGRVVFAGGADRERAAVVPSYRLTAKARARLAKAALLVTPFVLFEACGGGAGAPSTQSGSPRRPGRTTRARATRGRPIARTPPTPRTLEARARAEPTGEPGGGSP